MGAGSGTHSITDGQSVRRLKPADAADLPDVVAPQQSRAYKFTAPRERPGMFVRQRLLDVLDANTDAELVIVAAPTGYGKTALLEQWGRRDPRPFAWLTVDAADADPARFISNCLTALSAAGVITAQIDGLEPVRPGSLEQSLPAFWALLEGAEPFVLVVDDAQFGEVACEATAAALSEHLAPGAQLAFLTRARVRVPLGKRRAGGGLLYLDEHDLALDDHGIGGVLKAVGVDSPEDAARLHEATEGWPAGVFLTALSIRRGISSTVDIGQSRAHIFDLLWEETVAGQPPDLIRFLLRISILDRFCAALCGAVADEPDPGGMLERVERSNMFMIALDDQRRWWRFHPLFRGMLRAESERREPDLSVELHRRAARWFQEHGGDGEIAHALQAGDRGIAAEAIGKCWRVEAVTGRISNLRSWMEAFTEEDIRDDPSLALTAGWLAGFDGHAAEMGRWGEIALAAQSPAPLPDGSASAESAVALQRAWFAFDGVSQMDREARLVVTLEAEDRPQYARGIAMCGVAATLAGSFDEASDRLERAVTLARHAAPAIAVFALSQLAMNRLLQGRWSEAEPLAREAAELAVTHDVDRGPLSLSVDAALARAVMELEGASGECASAARRSYAALRRPGAPWIGLQAGLVLEPVLRRLNQPRLHSTLLARLHATAERHPHYGILSDLARARPNLRPPVTEEPITEAELRILRLLATRLSQQEIGRELSISQNTVKSHKRSIYHKLNVHSRADAVASARKSGLL
jgi:LuxR family maltose regulon positive regulatory protein